MYIRNLGASRQVVTKSKTLLDERKKRAFVGWHPFPSQLLANILGNTLRVKCFGDVMYYPKASSEPTLSRSDISSLECFLFPSGFLLSHGFGSV